MGFNPLQEKGIPIERQFRNWSELNTQPYDKDSVHPYTRCRGIVMNGIEVESILFSHQMARHAPDLELKRMLATTRRIEQQQQKAVNWMIPGQESTLEVTIGYEQVAVDLTAWVARNEPDPYARQVYEFGLLEDFDHLYRYADLLDLMEGKKAEKITGPLTEIMPGRPTILEHRHPHDDIRKPLDFKSCDPLSILHAMTVMAAEQQTMNYYMNVGNRPTDPLARGLYLEIAQIEEQHVTHYESLLDAKSTWAEMLVLHEYNECYLYHSFLQDEVDPRVKQVWDTHLAMEIEHLRIACDIMRQIDGRDAAEMLPKELPQPTRFEENKDYVRQVLASQVNLTADGTDFVPMDSLPQDHRYHQYQRAVNGPDGQAPSKQIIEEYIRQKGGEYRSEPNGPHPVDWMRLPQAAE